MKRLSEIQCANFGDFRDRVRGKQLARAAVTAVNAGTKTVTVTGATFLDDGVVAGCIVRDLTTGKAARVVTPAQETLVLDEWINTLATQVIQVFSPPILPVDVQAVAFERGTPVLYVRMDDAIERETEVFRQEVAWLMATGAPVAARNRSFPFYVPPGKAKVTIELPFTHNANIEVHRYHGDWLSLAVGDAVLLPNVAADWEQWPAGKALILAANPVAEGSYAMDMLEDVMGNIRLVNPHAGWYRLDSAAAGADKVLTVCMENV